MRSTISKYVLRATLVLAAGLLIGTSLRANAAPGQSKSPETLSTTNQAEKILERCMHNTHALQTLACTLQITSSDFWPGQMYQETYHVAYAGPRKVAVHRINTRTAGPSGTEAQQMSVPHGWHDIVADGKRYYVFDANINKYILHPLNSKGWEAEEGTGAGSFEDSFLGDLLINGRKASMGQVLKDSQYLGQESVDGVSCDKIRNGTSDQDLSLYWIGHADGLLRKVQSTVHGATITETYTILQTRGPLSPQEFAIKPPPGAIRVDRFGQAIPSR